MRARNFLPMTPEEMAAQGIRRIDVLLVTGDAYFDHPSHGAALIGRLLEDVGYRVGIVARPNWRSIDDFVRLGRPTLFAGVTAGAVDSMINNFTADMVRRRNDAYAPGGTGGGRPDFATLVYANRIREAFPGLPVVIGGVEASLRRFAYFDPLKKKVRRSILVDSRADLLVYGPGEHQIINIASRLANGQDLVGIPGTVRLARDDIRPDDHALKLPEYNAVEADTAKLITQALAVEMTGRPGFDRQVYQRYAEGIVLAEPRPKLSGADLDRFCMLPFSRDQHPIYKSPIPALETVRWSVVSHRGCPGGCSFCTLAAHQGRQVVSRSLDSVIEEVRDLTLHPEFKGTLTDIGGPTANAYIALCNNLKSCSSCKRPSCLHPRICRHLATDHNPLTKLLERAAKVPNVKHVLLASGVRHDLAIKDPKFIELVAKHHTGGHLKVAPEHVEPSVLKRMRKPPIELFEKFEEIFLRASSEAGKEQYLVPYFVAAFPGCKPEHADATGRWLSRRGQRLRQVQSFIPLPGTVAAAFHAARVDDKGAPLFVADLKERRRQKALLTGDSSTKKKSVNNRKS